MMIEAVSVEAVGGGARFSERPVRRSRVPLPRPALRTKFFSGGEWRSANVYTRDQLKPGSKVKGAAIIVEPHQTVVIEPGWQAEITAKNHLVLARVKKLNRTHAIGTHADPVMLEVFNNLFMSIAEQMGVSLQNTAYSVNIKERLDFSCAVFAHDGTLVAECTAYAGSSGVHGPRGGNGNSGKCRAVRPGNVYAINAPYNGGTTFPTSPFAHRYSTIEKKQSCFGSHHVGIMPMSEAFRPVPCRRMPQPSSRKVSFLTISSSSTVAAFGRKS